MQKLKILLVPFYLLYLLVLPGKPKGVQYVNKMASIPCLVLAPINIYLWYQYGTGLLLGPFSYGFFDAPWIVVLLFFVSIIWFYSFLIMLGIIIGAFLIWVNDK